MDPPFPSDRVNRLNGIAARIQARLILLGLGLVGHLLAFILNLGIVDATEFANEIRALFDQNNVPLLSQNAHFVRRCGEQLLEMINQQHLQVPVPRPVQTLFASDTVIRLRGIGARIQTRLVLLGFGLIGHLLAFILNMGIVDATEFANEIRALLDEQNIPLRSQNAHFVQRCGLHLFEIIEQQHLQDQQNLQPHVNAVEEPQIEMVEQADDSVERQLEDAGGPEGQEQNVDQPEQEHPENDNDSVENGQENVMPEDQEEQKHAPQSDSD